jgi:hypothetical protein
MQYCEREVDGRTGEYHTASSLMQAVSLTGVLSQLEVISCFGSQLAGKLCLDIFKYSLKQRHRPAGIADWLLYFCSLNKLHRAMRIKNG